MSAALVAPAGDTAIHCESAPGSCCGGLIQATHCHETPKNAVAPSDSPSEELKLCIKFGKENFEVILPNSATVQELKQELERRTTVPPFMQKVMYKGLLKEDGRTLAQSGVKTGTKLMLIGSTVEQVINVNVLPKPVADTVQNASESAASSEQKLHEKVIKLGPPADALQGTDAHQIPFPPNAPISGMYSGRGDRIRVTVKIAINELWIASNTTTQKIPFEQMEDVSFTSIPDHHGYSIVTLKMHGNHKMFLYFMPTQYTRNFRNYILGWEP